MQQQKKRVFSESGPEKMGPERDVPRQIEHVTCGLGRQCVHLTRRQVGILHEHLRLTSRQNSLLRLPAHRREYRPQALVTLHEITKRCPQSIGVELSGKSQQDRHIINRTLPLKLLHEPKTALRKGQRNHNLLPRLPCPRVGEVASPARKWKPAPRSNFRMEPSGNLVLPEPAILSVSPS